MSEQVYEIQSTTQRPTYTYSHEVCEYWQTQNYPWRTEPEIDDERKAVLKRHSDIAPDIQHGIYPFKHIEPRLSRADIEWLLATYQGGHGPIEWSDPGQQSRNGLDLRGANLIGVDLSGLPLARLHGGLTESERANTTTKQRAMAAIHLQGANLFEAHLEGAFLAGGHFEGADLSRAYLQNASLMYAHLEGANLRTAHLEGTFLGFAHLNGKLMEHHEYERVRKWKGDFPQSLPPAHLRFAFLDRATNLDSVNLGDEHFGFVSVVDVRWGDVNLAMVNWEKIHMLGDEYWLLRHKAGDGTRQEQNENLRDYRRAARANRQLAIALQSQGLNEEAAHFAYRAQNLQRKVSWRRRKYGQYFFSLFLNLLAGYGYKPFNSFLAYVCVCNYLLLARPLRQAAAFTIGGHRLQHDFLSRARLQPRPEYQPGQSPDGTCCHRGLCGSGDRGNVHSNNYSTLL